jgi:hypothetical protein
MLTSSSDEREPLQDEQKIDQRCRISKSTVEGVAQSEETRGRMTRFFRLAVTIIVLPERVGMKPEVNSYLKVKQLLDLVPASKRVFLSM